MPDLMLRIVTFFRRGLQVVGSAALLSAFALAPVEGTEGGLFGAETFTLDNGLQVVLLENRRAPVVTHMVWYRVGAADDPPGKSGTAHFLEHLMFKGTATVGADRFSELVAERGGVDNAFTAADYSGYFQRVAREHLGFVMSLEADRMQNLAFSDEDALRERDVILEERNSRTDNDPEALLFEQVRAAQFLNHPYGTPIIGWRHEIEALSPEDARAFYERHYAPNNAILVVAGDIAADDLRSLAEKHYGAIPPAPALGPRERRQEPPQNAPRRVEMTDERAAKPGIVRSYLTPGHGGGAPETAALSVLAEILGGGRTGRLYRSLVVEQGISPQAGASYNPVSVDPGAFWIYADAFVGEDIEPVEMALDAAVAALVDGKLAESEVETAKQRMIAGTVYLLDNPRSVARVYGRALASGIDIGSIESWTDRLAAVTREQVVEAARLVLRRERSVTGILRPGEPG